LNKSVKAFEDAGEVERPAARKKAVTYKRQWPDIESPGCAPNPRTTFKPDQGRNATPIRQPRDFIRAPKRAAYPLFFGVGGTGKMISEAIFQSLEIAIELKIVKNGFGVPSCPVGDTQDICVSA
jgi:hypothetical protein